MRVHIPVNLRHTPPFTGDWASFVGILDALGEGGEGFEFEAVFNSDPSSFPVRPGPGLRTSVLAPAPWPWRSLGYEPWLQLLFPRGRRGEAGLFLDAKMPLAWKGPSVVRIQDLAFHLFPDCFTAKDRFRLKAETLLAVRKATRLLAISRATRDDLVRIYGADPARIAVAYNGVGREFVPLPPDHPEVARVRSRHRLHRPYVLTVGTLQRRKNLGRLLRAWEIMREKADPGCDLVVAGGRGWLFEDLLAYHSSMGLKDEVRLPGPVPQEDLPGLYAGARAFILPSLYEGFGIPLAEAMACGVPCLASRVSSLPEVGGEAVEYFDPRSEEEMAAALARVLGDEEIRRALAARGPRQAAAFTWKEAARRMGEALREARDG